MPPTNRTIRKKRKKKGRMLGPVLDDASKSVGRITSGVLDMTKPFIGKAYEYGNQMISEQLIPSVPNKASWEDLRRDFSEGLVRLGIIEKIISPTTYYQSLKRFLDNHSEVIINKEEIRLVRDALKSIGILPNDSTPMLMKTFFENGITHDSLISSFEFGFQNILFPEIDMDMDLEPQLAPGEGFKMVAEKKTSELELMRKKINNLVGEIINKRNALKASKLEPSITLTLKEQKKKLIEDLSKLIGTPGTEKETEQALKDIPELTNSASLMKKRKRKKSRKKKQ